MNKMKIVFLVNMFPRLSETFILNQITGLIERGHEVDIYANRKGNEPKMHEDVEKYNLLSRTTYYGEAIPADKIVRILKAFVLFMSHFHKNPRALLKALNVFKFKKEAANLSILYRVVHFLGRGDYDIIHCHFGPNGIIGSTLKNIGALRGRVITTFHGADMSKAIRENGDGFYEKLFLTGDMFLPVSKRWQDELLRMGCDSRKIAVHRMGIDVGQFANVPRSPKEDGRINILSVARLVEKKGIRYAITALARAVERFPKLEYIIIGDGPLRKDIGDLIESLNMGRYVKLLGWRPKEEVAGFMKAADIFLAPSVTANDGDQEGIPVALMEAMAVGLPVVSTYHSGIPELVKDAVSGILCPGAGRGCTCSRTDQTT